MKLLSSHWLPGFPMLPLRAGAGSSHSCGMTVLEHHSEKTPGRDVYLIQPWSPNTLGDYTPGSGTKTFPK